MHKCIDDGAGATSPLQLLLTWHCTFKHSPVKELKISLHLWWPQIMHGLVCVCVCVCVFFEVFLAFCHSSNWTLLRAAKKLSRNKYTNNYSGLSMGGLGQ